MKLAAFIAGMLYCTGIFCQNQAPIVVTTQSINIPGSLEVMNWKNSHPDQSYPQNPKMEFGFAAGDEIVVDFTPENKKGTRQIQITELASQSVVYSNIQFQTLEGIRIKVPKNNVYKFEFANNNLEQCQCKVCIKRIPAAGATKNFNCNVTWKTVYDTTFAMAERRTASNTYEAVMLQTPIDFSLLQGGKSRIAVPVTLPANTVSWYYSFSATRNSAAVPATKSSMKLFNELTRLINQSGTLAFGTNALTQPPGANYCDIYVLDENSRTAFLNKNDGNWHYDAEGSRKNLMSGIVQVANVSANNTFYIGIKNPDATYGVSVMIEVVAIVEKTNYETVQFKQPVSVTKKIIPVFGI